MIMGQFNVNSGPWDVIMGPRNVNCGPWNVIMTQCNVIMGWWNVKRGPGRLLWDREM